MSDQVEKSGVHLSGADSGWPVADAGEPGYEKAGDGTDALPHATAVSGGLIADNGTDEVETVTLTGVPTGGTFTVKQGAAGDPSDPIAFNATAAAFKTGLDASDDFATEDTTVTGNAGGPWTITFKGAHGDKNVAQLQLGTNSLTGGTAPAPAFATTTPGAPR